MSSASRSLASSPAELEAEGLQRLHGDTSVAAYIRAMWRLRDFIVTVPMGQLRAQSQSTILGSFWHLLRPLLHAGVFFVVFGILFDARRNVENYVAFLVVGMFVFTYTSRTATGGAGAIVANQRLMQSIRFPRAVLPLAATIGETVAQLPAIAIMIVLVLITGEVPALAWLALPVALAVQALFNFGLACITSRLTYHFRDVQQFLPYLLQMWMYLSGLFFTVDYVEASAPHWMVVVFRLNPLYSYMQIFRGILLDGKLHPNTWILGIAWALLACAVGFSYFKARDHAYAQS